MFLHRGVFTIEVFFYTIVDETCSAPDVVFVAIVTGDLVHGGIFFLSLMMLLIGESLDFRFNFLQ